MRRNKGAVLLSGGADSATLLYLALVQCEEVHAVSVNYGQRHVKELECAKKLCKLNNIPHIIIPFDLTIFGGSPLTDSSLAIPEQKEHRQTSTVVPFRNTILITLCAAYCKQHNLNTVYIGATHEDLASYEDCRGVFFKSLQDSLRLGGTVHDLKIQTPFIDSYKEDIITLGHTKFSVPYEDTWTCYSNGSKPCLKCDACVERINAFILAGIKDPLVSDAQWEELQINFNNKL